MMLADAAEVTVAPDGQAALDAFDTAHFDVILMDSQMPVMDGLAATRAIREREAAACAPATPIISLTANAMPHQIEASLAAGADLHLAKPVSMEALFQTIKAALGMREEGRADERLTA